MLNASQKETKRLTATLTKDQYSALERLAKQNDVKLAWLVRKAVERLIVDAEGGPLLPMGLRK